MKKLLLTLCMLLTSAPAFAQDRNDELRDRNARQERGREQAQDQTDWDAEYTAYLKENPGVANAVESGRVSKEKVLAGIKARAAEAWEAKLKRSWEYEKRDDPRRWVGKTFEQVRSQLEEMLRYEGDDWEHDNEEEAAKRDPWEAKFQVFLRQNPALREHIALHGLRKENVIKLLQHGDAKLDENDKAAQQARSDKALRAALKIMTDAKKLKPEQAKQLYEIVFPPVVDWEAKYVAYLKENPGIANAVANGKTTKEKVMVGIKAREGEKPLTDEQKIEALYQKLQREDRTLGRTTKEQLMPQLKKMLARGEAEGLRPEQSQLPRTWKWGLTFLNLIETGQIERSGKDQKLVSDFGCIEILRQSGPQPEGQGGGDERVRAERVREREDAARGNDRAVDGSGQKVPGTLKWSVLLGGAVGYHSPAVAEDGTIYMAGGRQRLVALHPDGTEKWAFVAGSGYPIAGAAIGQDGTIYIGTWSEDGSDSRIYAITADGTEKWSYPVGDKIEFSSPAIGKDGTIYIGCYDDHLYAMNPDGTLRWRFRADFNLMSSPAVGQDGTIYIASENGKLYAVNPEDGGKKWDFQTGNYIHGSPSIAKDGTVYIGSSDKNLYALNPDGSEKWRFTAQDQVHAPPAIGEDGTLYVGSNDGSFYALNPDGTKKWSFRTGKRVDNCSAAIGKDGTIYFGSDDNHIYALNPDGSEKWRFRMNGVDDMDSSPAIGEDGTIYVGSMDGNLYAIHGESGGLAETPWPMFGGDPRHTGRAQPEASARANK